MTYNKGLPTQNSPVALKVPKWAEPTDRKITLTTAATFTSNKSLDNRRCDNGCYPTKNMASKGTTHIKRSNKTDNSILNVYDDILFKKSFNYNLLHDLDVR